jgi:hypothetical protein
MREEGTKLQPLLYCKNIKKARSPRQLFSNYQNLKISKPPYTKGGSGNPVPSYDVCSTYEPNFLLSVVTVISY